MSHYVSLDWPSHLWKIWRFCMSPPTRGVGQKVICTSKITTYNTHSNDIIDRVQQTLGSLLSTFYLWGLDLSEEEPSLGSCQNYPFMSGLTTTNLHRKPLKSLSMAEMCFLSSIS